MQHLLAIKPNQRFELSSSYAKIYPTFTKLYKYSTPKFFSIDNLEIPSTTLKHHTYSQETPQERSIRRTKTTIQDITLSNNFQLFCTFTFAKDRHNIQKCKATMSNWLKSQKKINSKLKYLIIPEFHKDLKAIHFHALISNLDAKLTPAKTSKPHKPIYNIKSYRSGFSTAIPIDGSPKLSSYLRKYITKDMPLFKGKKRYWCSQGLERPRTTHKLEILTSPLFEKELLYSNEIYSVYRIDVNMKELIIKGDEYGSTEQRD